MHLVNHAAIWGVHEDLLVGCGVLGYFVLFNWCGVEVWINWAGSKGGVFGVLPSGLWFCGRGEVLFFAGWRVSGMISVYSSFFIGSGEYCFFCHPSRFPVDIE